MYTSPIFLVRSLEKKTFKEKHVEALKFLSIELVGFWIVGLLLIFELHGKYAEHKSSMISLSWIPLLYHAWQ